jgi:hypothetical protein
MGIRIYLNGLGNLGSGSRHGSLHQQAIKIEYKNSLYAATLVKTC